MSAPRVKLALQPIPKSLLRVGVAGEFLKSVASLDDATIRNVQQAVAEGLVSELIVVGVSGSKIAKERFVLRFDPLGNDDTINLDLSNGKSMSEALDTGFAGAVAYSVQLLQRRALKPMFFITWSVYAESGEVDLEAACRRLNLSVNVGPEPIFRPDGAPSIPSHPPVYAPPPTYSPPSYSEARSTTYRADASSHQRAYTQPRPYLPPDVEYTPVLRITPAKDKGISYSIETAKRNT